MGTKKPIIRHSWGDNVQSDAVYKQLDELGYVVVDNAEKPYYLLKDPVKKTQNFVSQFWSHLKETL